MHRDPDLYRIKRGGGCLFIIGLPAFAYGIGRIVIALAGAMQDDVVSTEPLYLVIPGGLISMAIGVAIMFARLVVDIDSRSRTITRWWGIFVPFKRTTTSFDEIKAVTISREERRSNDSTTILFPVRVSREGGSIDIDRSLKYADSRRRAEEVAKFLGIGIEDSTSGKTIIREAGTLDMSLRDKVKASGKPVERPPEQPAESRIKVTSTGSQATFDIPAPGVGGITILGIGVCLLLLSVPIIAYSVITSSPDLLEELGRAWPVPVVVSFFWVPGWLWVIVSIIRDATARVRLIINPREIKIETRSFMGTKTKRIPADELEEIDLERPKEDRSRATSDERIVAQADRVKLEFGKGLSHKELVWMVGTIRSIVTSS